jgi:hypothetical protein
MNLVSDCLFQAKRNVAPTQDGPSAYPQADLALYPESRRRLGEKGAVILRSVRSWSAKEKLAR